MHDGLMIDLREIQVRVLVGPYCQPGLMASYFDFFWQ